MGEDTTAELCALLKEAGLVPYAHRPGCPMKDCGCRWWTDAGRDAVARAVAAEREACAEEAERLAELLREGVAGQSTNAARPALATARYLSRVAANIRARGGK